MSTKVEITKALASLTELSAETIETLLETPKNADQGDLSFPCFRLAKDWRKAPAAIAAELADKLPEIVGLARAEAVSGYLNFFFGKADFAAVTLARVLSEGERYGASELGGGKTVCVEFSSINIAKPFHIGHLPSTAIGAALNRIYDFLGYRTVAINHLGDWGTQFGKMIVAYRLWGQKPVLDYTVRELVALYVRYHDEAEKDPALDDQAREWFCRMEQGDAEAMALWSDFAEVSLTEAKLIYDRLGVAFDSYAGESFYEDKMQPIIDELREKKISKEDDGAVIVDLTPWDMPPALIVKRDGSTIYLTRDLAAADYRKAMYDFVRSLYVVAYQQDLHFRQLFKILELLGRSWADDCVHVNFGMVSMEEGTLSTRSGNVVYLSDVLNAAVTKAREIIGEKSPDLEGKDAVAEVIGVGALLWSVLYHGRIKDTAFSWAKALSFEGETGPYVQYTHARCCSVLRKIPDSRFQIPVGRGLAPAEIDVSVLDEPYSLAVIKAIAAFPQAIEAAAEKNEPYLVARAVMAVCTAFNKFYYERRIVGEEPATQNARLALTEATRQTIANGLKLLGLVAPTRM
ncbi:MAG: arginine--tRNA ligase [Clostridiales bacterium]|nr:arginine--tRNA ligase [Clostridiales bacterium]